LIGFLLVTFISTDRNLQAIELNLNDYNSGVNPPNDQPRNPIPFNSPSDSTRCQPGKCFYEFPIVDEELTDELYFYCGIQSTLEESDASCSIEFSEDITSRITQAGAGAEALIATGVLNVSQSHRVLFDASSNHGR
jgi:hypothetical protein